MKNIKTTFVALALLTLIFGVVSGTPAIADVYYYGQPTVIQPAVIQPAVYRTVVQPVAYRPVAQPVVYQAAPTYVQSYVPVSTGRAVYGYYGNAVTIL